MYLILWEYHIRAEKQQEFERFYASHGPWATLFQLSPAYLETELIQDGANPLHYFTLDRWRSKQEYESFLQVWRKEYDDIEIQSENLTEQENLIVKGELHAQP